MRFFHLSDLHIGKLLYRYNLLQDQSEVLKQIVSLAQKERPDAILMTGDIYDRPVPSAEAVQLFDAFLSQLAAIRPQIPILMISGNHDSAQRLEYASGILENEQVYVAGMPPVTGKDHIRRVSLQDEDGDVDFYLLPFIRPSMVRGVFDEEENVRLIKKAKETGRGEYDVYFEALLQREEIDASRRNVLLTHQFFAPQGSRPERTDSEIMTVGMLDRIDTCHLTPFDYVAMGHIHRAQKCGGEEFRYCGTPMAYSVSEEKDQKAVTVVTIQKKGVRPQISYLPLQPLRRVRRVSGSLEEILAGEYSEDYVSVCLTGDQTGRFVTQQIRENFPNYLEIILDAPLRKKEGLQRDTADLSLDYQELFGQFFEMQNNRPMTEDERELFQAVYQEAGECEI